MRCLNRHISKGDLVNCVTDLCNGLRAKNLRKFEKRARTDKRKGEGLFKKRKQKKKFYFF